MRVCLLSKYGQSSNLLYEGTRIGLEQNGIEYIDINISLLRKEEPLRWTSIPTLIPSQPKPTDKEILAEIKEFNPDVILLLQYSGLPFLIDNGEEIRSILGTKGKVGFWFVDLAEEVHMNKKLGEYIDYFFVSNEGQLAEYTKKWGISNSYFMPQGGYITQNFPKNINRKHRVGFLGRRQRQDTRYNERNKLLDTIKNKYNLFETDTVFDSDSAVTFYHQCKIIIGSSWRNDIYLYSSDRIFNVLGSGTLYMCTYFPGVEKIFQNNEHLVWFNNIPECINLINKFIQNDEEREQIAYNGYQIIKDKHTYKLRIKNIVDIIHGLSNSFESFL